MTKHAPYAETADPMAILVTGPSGAGRSTAINALEDLGFEVIDNLPLSILTVIDRLTEDLGHRLQVLYLDAQDDVLLRRYSETRRRHPLAGDGPPIMGIDRDKELLAPIRDRAELLIDTTSLSPHDLRAEVDKHFAPGKGRPLSVTVHSFSYKRGVPRGLDLMFDCRFLRNPHWDDALRPLDGRNQKVADYVWADAKADPFLNRVTDLLDLTLPAHRDEGRAHLSIGFGCTGGKHRSVALTERLTERLAQKGWQVSKRHRELDRNQAAQQAGQGHSQ